MAIDAVNEILFYIAPLDGKWKAPPHPYLLAEQGEPPANWMRQGPAALTRAWCIFEMAKAQAKKCKLHVLLADSDRNEFKRLMRDPVGFEKISQLTGRIDVKQAQISKADDRSYILGEVAKLDGGLGELNATVMNSLKGWIADGMEIVLNELPEAQRGTSSVLYNLQITLRMIGRLDEGEKYCRELYQGRKERFGENAEDTLGSLNSLGITLMAQGLSAADQAKRTRCLSDSEGCFKKYIQLMEKHHGLSTGTINGLGNLGLVLHHQMKLDESEKYAVKALDLASKKWGPGHSWFYITAIFQASLAELRLKQGRVED